MSDSQLKIRGYSENGGYIDTSKVKKVMTLLAYIREEINQQDITKNMEDMSPLESMNMLREHAKNPENALPAAYMQRIAEKSDPQYIDYAGAILFGKDWREQLANDTVHISDPEVRAIIAAAEPAAILKLTPARESQSSSHAGRQKIRHANSMMKNLVIRGNRSKFRDNGLSSVLVEEIYEHARHPELKINPDRALELLDVNGGEQIGNYLFGKGWQTKAQHGEDIMIADEDIQKAIGSMEINLDFNHASPIDERDKLSRDMANKWAVMERDTYHRRNVVQLESGESLHEVDGDNPYPAYMVWSACRDNAKELKIAAATAI